MAKYKKSCIILALLSILCVQSVHGNGDVERRISGGYQSEREAHGSASATLNEQDMFVSENDVLALYVNEETLAIKVKNKQTDYIFDSVVNDETMNKTWQGFSQSGLSVEYMNDKGKVEKASIVSHKAKVQIQNIEDGFHADIDFQKLGFNIGVDVSLKDDALVVKVPQGGFQESKKENALLSLYLFPFLGSTYKQEVGGYMFVPDGSGALIRLDEENTLGTLGYQARVYGEDYGVSGTSDSVKDASKLQQIHMPVYGMVHNALENGFVSILEEGSEYAKIMATPAGITTDYNWISAYFVIRDPYFKLINKKLEGYETAQEIPNEFSISMQFKFLSGEDANYVGMAKHYRSYLQQQGVLSKQAEKQEIPLHVDFLMSERKKTLFGSKPVIMSTPSQIREITTDLKAEGISALDITLRGYSKLGSEQETMVHTNYEKKVIREDELESFASDMKQAGNKVFLRSDYMRSYGGAKGYREGSDSALSLSEQLLQFRNQKDVYVAPQTMIEFYQDEVEDILQSGVSGLSMQSVGSTLYSNFNERNRSTRSETKERIETMLAEKEMAMNLYHPNVYAWKDSDAMMQIAMHSSNYVLFSDNVPFLQIVLKGSKDYYAPELNFSYGSQKELLRMVDYGAYPSYILTKEDARALIGTKSDYIYTSSYDSLKQDILDQYNFMKEGLLATEGKQIVARDVIADDVVCVRYDDQSELYLNYRESVYEEENMRIEPLNYIVVKGE